jgi:hypothetical protein
MIGRPQKITLGEMRAAGIRSARRIGKAAGAVKLSTGSGN